MKGAVNLSCDALSGRKKVLKGYFGEQQELILKLGISLVLESGLLVPFILQTSSFVHLKPRTVVWFSLSI